MMALDVIIIIIIIIIILVLFFDPGYSIPRQ